jgi:hypothetical protein
MKTDHAGAERRSDFIVRGGIIQNEEDDAVQVRQ